MRLPAFIESNVEPILVEWESFARRIWPQGRVTDPVELRDEAADILRATVDDMRSEQTEPDRTAKSQGRRRQADGQVLTDASSSHGTGRAVSGLDLWAMVAEYRALRATVLRLWRRSKPDADLNDIDDVTRFNESMDQSLTYAIQGFAEAVERTRATLLASERASRREAEEANQAKDLFLATLSHEMRTPLNAVVGWLSILRRPDTPPALVSEGLNVIDRSTMAQVQLIDDLLDVSRIVSGKLRLDIQSCELAEAVSAGVTATQAMADARNITITVSIAPGAGRASCDASRMQQVMWNLISNAVKFTPKGGHVSVSLGREQSHAVITVSDTGLGISSDLLPRIFDRFRQADSSMRRKHAGLGLGLSIVKYIVEAHGGTVEAASMGEGKGSTFTVRLPVSMEQMAGSSHAVSSGPDRQSPVRLDGIRILLVDDEADARRVMTVILEKVGATVTTAGSVVEALQKLADAPPDVLVSDLGMPEQDGFDLIRHLRSASGVAVHLPAVALTAFVHKDDAERVRQAGFQEHVPKPVDPRELTRVIARLALRSSD